MSQLPAVHGLGEAAARAGRKVAGRCPKCTYRSSTIATRHSRESAEACPFVSGPLFPTPLDIGVRVSSLCIHLTRSMEEQKHMIVETRNELLQAQLKAQEANHTPQLSQSGMETTAQRAKPDMGDIVWSAIEQASVKTAAKATPDVVSQKQRPRRLHGLHVAAGADDSSKGTNDEGALQSGAAGAGSASHLKPNLQAPDPARRGVEPESAQAKAADPEPSGETVQPKLSAWAQRKRAFLNASAAMVPPQPQEPEPAAASLASRLGMTSPLAAQSELRTSGHTSASASASASDTPPHEQSAESRKTPRSRTPRQRTIAKVAQVYGCGVASLLHSTAHQFEATTPPLSIAAPFLSFCETRAHAGSRESPVGTAPHRHGSCPSGQRCWRVRTRFVSESCPLGESRHRQFMEWVCLRRETPRSSSMSPGRRKSVADLPIKRSEPTSISKRKGSISGFIDALKDTGSAERCVRAPLKA